LSFKLKSKKKKLVDNFKELGTNFERERVATDKSIIGWWCGCHWFIVDVTIVDGLTIDCG